MDGAVSSDEPLLVRVVWGAATAPLPIASYDAALAAAGVHNYNLTHVSSVVPADAVVEAVGTAPDLGPAGRRLTVVEARATVEADRATAVLGWATGDGPGLFYEVAGSFDEPTGRREVRDGLAACRDLRDWSFGDEGAASASVTAADGGYATAVALAVYGASEPIGPRR